MKLVLLSGGSGKRLWPLSNDVRSKQFLKVFKREDGIYESMVQRVCRQIKSVDNQIDITIATSKNQVSTIRNQVGDDVSICVEPCRRDTFPAIVLAASFLHDVKGVSNDEVMVICPVDPYVDVDYFDAIKSLEAFVSDDEGLMLMGIEPTYPSEKYGYILPELNDVTSKVSTFKEKPDKKAAQRYMEQGALWNSGVFAFRLEYVLKKAHEHIDFTDYDDLYSDYGNLKKISFDYAVVEQEPNIQVMRFNGNWKDIGTWNTLAEEMTEPFMGDVRCDDACENINVINELDVPVLCMGLKDIIISSSAEGILVSNRENSSYIKPFVDDIEQEIMFAEKSWGNYRVLDVQKDSMTILVTLKPGSHMNYHSHDYRDEVWTVISGTGKTIVDGMEEPIHMGDVVAMQAGCRHTIISETELKLIEVQLGTEINVQDKHKYVLES